MTDSNFSSEPVNSEPPVFRELPKERQKALRKEYSKTSKAGRNIIICSIIIAAAMIAIAVAGIFSEHWVFAGCVFPAWIFPVFAASEEEKFIKWLKAEKNIVMKRKKQKP